MQPEQPLVPPSAMTASIAEADLQQMRAELQNLRAFKAGIDAIERAPYHDVPIFIDYPPVERPRWGYDKPRHPELLALIEAGRESYRGLLQSMLAHSDRFVSIPNDAPDYSGGPYWTNGWIPPLDTAALYTLLGRNNPKLYLEVGSGHSTRFARRAIKDLGLRTRIVSIDPQPRSDIDAICDEVVRQPLESCDLSLLPKLEPGDVFFVDNSHRVFMNSDATVCFMDVLPRLPPGVLVHFHDIFLPDDYPMVWASRHYSEQYLLGCYLLGGAGNVKVLLPNRFVTTDADLSRVLEPLWARLPGAATNGVSFWLETV